MKTIRMIVSGRVQRVAFRHHTREEAHRLGVRGYVRNLPDGSVEIVAQGSDEQVEALTAWARQGPRWARVDDLRLTETPSETVYEDFTVRF